MKQNGTKWELNLGRTGRLLAPSPRHYRDINIYLPLLTKRPLSYTIKRWDKSQVEPGKYTSNCRENQAGTITS